MMSLNLDENILRIYTDVSEVTQHTLLINIKVRSLTYNKIFQMECFEMDIKAKMEEIENLLKQFGPQFMYLYLCYSESMHEKNLYMELLSIYNCLNNTLSVLYTDTFSIISGSKAEGTPINSTDYLKHVHSETPCYVSDSDCMQVMYKFRVIEGDTLPQRFDDHIYCRAERGEHTTDGFRKIRLIHRPESLWQQLRFGPDDIKTINQSHKHGYISSSRLLANTEMATYPFLPYSLKAGKN